MSKPLAPSVTHRDRKGLKFMSIVEAAYDKATLSEDEAQRVNEAPGLAEVVRSFIRNSLFVNCVYPSDYTPRPVTEQLDVLRELFPKLNFEHAQRFVETILPTLTLPEGAEGWFAIPRSEAVAWTYNKAVDKVLSLLESRGKFENLHKGQTGWAYMRQHRDMVRGLREIARQQPGDILIIPAQFGLRHRGHAGRGVLGDLGAREHFTYSEFGLGAFAIGVMLLTHPQRFQSYNDIWIDCIGDEYAPNGRGDWRGVQCFRSNGDTLYFSGRWDGPEEHSGSPSGFVPQQQ